MLINATQISIVLDVIIVASLCYWLLSLLKGTRAIPMTVGIFAVLVLYWVSQKFALVTVSWVLGNFLGSSILVIVILFQDDFRRALIKVGLVSGLGSESSVATRDLIEEVAEACSILSKKKTGAIIVIQQEIGLKEYTERAAQIDSVVTHQILLSIFNVKSPLHDGAVIICGGRIYCAGAVLPLSFSPKVTSLGTRHRASMGMSERTDAIVVTVSEETGTISLFQEGKLSLDLSKKSLVSALERRLKVK